MGIGWCAVDSLSEQRATTQGRSSFAISSIKKAMKNEKELAIIDGVHVPGAAQSMLTDGHRILMSTINGWKDDVLVN